MSDKKKQKEKKDLNKKQIFFLILASAAIGFINGFFGGGGGMVCVPLLEGVLKIENKKAHATAIAIILPLSIISSIFYVLKNTLSANHIFYTAVGVYVGGFLGAILLNKLNGKYVRLIFAVIMLAAGVKMVLS